MPAAEKRAANKQASAPVPTIKIEGFEDIFFSQITGVPMGISGENFYHKGAEPQRLAKLVLWESP
jgi:hypothetical protein